MPDDSLELFDPRRGGLALRVETITEETDLTRVRRSNYFTILWISQGEGTFSADTATYSFSGSCLLFFVPYQALQLVPGSAVSGHRIQFHANFLCIETYHEEIGCNGVLFNDIHSVPLVRMEPPQKAEFHALIDALRQELREGGLAHTEVLVSYLKILLVRATRMKLDQQDVAWEPQGKRPSSIVELKRLIETHYRELHKPKDYAALLHITPKALAKLVKTHLHKTLTQLIRERILRQARWELLHTRKPVQQIAREIGFEDVFYFSRLFKQAAGCSPTFFREFETEIRGGRNLSMLQSDPSILSSSSLNDH
jgi:AraC family transcriptional activator of pobA